MTVRKARTLAHSLAVELSSIGSGGLNVEDKQLVYKAERLLEEARQLLFSVKAQDESSAPVVGSPLPFRGA